MLVLFEVIINHTSVIYVILKLKWLQRKLQKEIVEQVKKCPQSMFIFDEIDKMPAGLIDIIKPFLDFHTSLDGVDYRKCIFVFLSNTAGDLIARQALTYWKDGIDRNRIALKAS